MNVSLTPELERYINEKVASGLYHSASEVIREGLRLLKDQDTLREIWLSQLQQQIKAGINSGEPKPLNLDGTIEHGKKHLAQRSKASN